MTLTLSRRLAYVLCPFFLGVDIWRRFGRWHEWPAILDDVIGGILLLVALIKMRRNASEGRIYLAAAWAYCFGMMYGSFVGQLENLLRPDPSGLPSRFVAAVKGGLVSLSLLGLVGALRRPASGSPGTARPPSSP